MEILVSVTVVAVIAAVAVPGLVSLLTNARLSAVEKDLVAQLKWARYEAVKRGTTVTMCSSADGAVCSGAKDWSKGWLLFADENRNLKPDAPHDLINAQQPNDDRVQLISTHAYLGYLADGSMVVY